MNKYLVPLISFASSVSAIKAEKYFSAIDATKSISLILSVTVAVLVYFLLTMVITVFPKRFLFFRKITMPTSGLEGYWFTEVNKPENPVSYACIQYDTKNDGFIYHGRNFGSDMSLHASFRSNASIEMQGSENIVSFHFGASMHRENSDSIMGAVVLNFYKDDGKNFDRGEGTVIDLSPGNLDKTEIALTRIPPAIVKSIIGKKIIRTNSDIYNVIEHLKNDPAYSRSFTGGSMQESPGE